MRRHQMPKTVPDTLPAQPQGTPGQNIVLGPRLPSGQSMSAAEIEAILIDILLLTDEDF